jgi:hypothetical protein
MSSSVALGYAGRPIVFHHWPIDATAKAGVFGLLIDLMRQIDRCEVNIVFFADEAGSWQVGVDWAEVLPAWFRSLSPATDPYDWAEAVVEALNDFAGYQMETLLAATRNIATPEQREALAEYEGNLRRRR